MLYTQERRKQKTADLHQAGGRCFLWRTLVYQRPRVTSEVHFQPPWHLGISVAASFSRQLLMLIARYQAVAKQSTEDIEVSPSPAEPNTFGFSLTEGSYSESIAGQRRKPRAVKACRNAGIAP